MTTAALLLRWYRRHGRDLPWRHTRDPYHILVSEIMLQQTQVPRGLIFYPRWLATFPTWETLARATNAEVIHAWAGLGYNRRALMLRDIAKQVVEQGIPQSEAEWRALKGIGPYTAAALAAFALHARTLPIDTNIRRVLGRVLLGIHFPDLPDDDRIRVVFETFLPRRGAYYDVPQALFDLATMVCTKTPNCATCPLRDHCKSATAFLAGGVKTPAKIVKKTHERIRPGKKVPDRIFRGRILAAVRAAPTGVRISTLGPLIDPTFNAAEDTDWIHAMVARMQKDGLVTVSKNQVTLPQH